MVELWFKLHFLNHSVVIDFILCALLMYTFQHYLLHDMRIELLVRRAANFQSGSRWPL